MPEPPDNTPKAHSVRVSTDELEVDLADGRRLAVPLDWYPRLQNATDAQRANWKLLGDGEGIHWPDADEDLSVEGLLRGSPSPESNYFSENAMPSGDSDDTVTFNKLTVQRGEQTATLFVHPDFDTSFPKFEQVLADVVRDAPDPWPSTAYFVPDEENALRQKLRQDQKVCIGIKSPKPQSMLSWLTSYPAGLMMIIMSGHTQIGGRSLIVGGIQSSFKEHYPEYARKNTTYDFMYEITYRRINPLGMVVVGVLLPVFVLYFAIMGAFEFVLVGIGACFGVFNRRKQSEDK